MATDDEDKRQTWQDWLAARRAASTMSVKPCRLIDTNGWDLLNKGERFGRPDSKFFNVIGVNVGEAGREVEGWGQGMAQEVAEGAVILVTNLGSNAFLLATKAEPGNDVPGCVLLGPTLAAGKSNLDQAHGGSRPPRAQLLDGRQVSWTSFRQDGGRFFRKTNQYAILAIDEAELGDLLPNERWFTDEEMKQAILAGDCSEHLLQCIALASALAA